MGDIEELIDLVLTGQHPKLRERCLVDRIVSVLEDTFGAYDAAGVRAVLADRRDEVSRCMVKKIPRLRRTPLRITALRPPALILNISS